MLTPERIRSLTRLLIEATIVWAFSTLILPPIGSVLLRLGDGLWNAVLDTTAQFTGRLNILSFLREMLYIVLAIGSFFVMNEIEQYRISKLYIAHGQQIQELIEQDKSGNLSTDDYRKAMDEIDKTVRLFKAQRGTWIRKEGGKWLKTLFTIFVFMVFLLVTSLTISIIIPLSRRTDFEISIERIAPYTNSKELLILKSDWVSMTTNAEYIDICKRITAIDEIRTRVP